MAKDSDDGRKTPTIAEIMEVLARISERLDRMAAEREADREAESAAAKERQADADKRRADADKRRADADKRQADADKRQADADKRQADADKRQAATDKQLQETDKQLQATSKVVQATGEYVRELGKQVGDVGNQWGKIAEYLVAGDFAHILKQRFGITIDHAAPSLSGSYQGKEWEVDVFAANGDIALVGEVKLTLTIEAVDKFVSNNLRNFHRYMPLYRDKKVYGLIGFLKMNRSEEKQITEYVHSLGLLLVKIINNTYHVLTPEGYKLKDYGVAQQ